MERRKRECPQNRSAGIAFNRRHSKQSAARVCRKECQQCVAAHVALRGMHAPTDRTLCGANLRNANLQAANLWQTDLRGADLTGADLTDANLPGTLFDESTILPDGTHWSPQSNLARFVLGEGS